MKEQDMENRSMWTVSVERPPLLYCFRWNSSAPQSTKLAWDLTMKAGNGEWDVAGIDEPMVPFLVLAYDDGYGLLLKMFACNPCVSCLHFAGQNHRPTYRLYRAWLGTNIPPIPLPVWEWQRKFFAWNLCWAQATVSPAIEIWKVWAYGKWSKY